MNDLKLPIFVSLLSSIPYLLIAWIYRLLTGGEVSAFWSALAVLIVTRAFFGVIDLIGSIAAWRIYGKNVIVEKILATFRSNQFPMREYADDALEDYLMRIMRSEEFPDSVKRIARDLEVQLNLFEEFGMLAGMRLRSAAETAYKVYTPKFSAKEFHNKNDTSP